VPVAAPAAQRLSSKEISMPRLAPLDLAKLTPQQKEVADAIRSGPRGGLRGPFEPWLRSPKLADRAQKLGEYCRFHNSLPKDLSELAIILIGRHFKAQYEFWAHARLAREAGLAEGVIEAIRTRRTPPFTRDIEAAVHDFVVEYLARNRVSDANYKRVLDAVGEQGVVDLVGVCGYYMLVSMTLNVFEMPLPPGEKEPLA
jgi:4-carboxymuconolactone decarboxylase